ncbi:MAG: hypothetical protein U9N86_10400 [Bacteroidota bacterium]|nr:hypothetical protein [Bacteroidota bacterium]
MALRLGTKKAFERKKGLYFSRKYILAIPGVAFWAAKSRDQYPENVFQYDGLGEGEIETGGDLVGYADFIVPLNFPDGAYIISIYTEGNDGSTAQLRRAHYDSTNSEILIEANIGSTGTGSAYVNNNLFHYFFVVKDYDAVDKVLYRAKIEYIIREKL